MVGLARSYPQPCTLEDLPSINFGVISYNHYDHLDFDTIKDIWKLHGDRIHFVVPSRMKKWFVATAELGIAHSSVTELGWWDSVLVSQTRQMTGSSISLVVEHNTVVDAEVWTQIPCYGPDGILNITTMVHRTEYSSLVTLNFNFTPIRSCHLSRQTM